MNTRNRPNGYSLIEVLACIALCIALFPMASKAYASISRLHVAENAALDRVLVFDNLERDFRAAAARAQAIEPALGPFKTAGQTVILRMPDGAYTVFTVDGKRQPRRVEITPAPGGWNRRTVPYALPRWRCRFETSAGGGIHFYARPIPQPGATSRSLPVVVHFLAALRAQDITP